MRQRGSIAASDERVTVALQLRTERSVVVDLSVEDDDHVAALVGNGLIACCEVDHTQPAIAERTPFQSQRRSVIRSAMADRRRGTNDRARVETYPALYSYDSADTTHGRKVQPSGRGTPGGRKEGFGKVTTIS